MGNQVCDSIKNQGEYVGRHNLKLLCSTVEPHNAPQQNYELKQSKSQSKYRVTNISINQESPKKSVILSEPNDLQQQQIQIKYQQNIIKCNRSCISYMKQKSTEQQKITVLNGFVKVYKMISQNKMNLIYEGEMRKSKFDGFGKMYKNDQLVYEGEFKNNLFDGWGITPQYEGEFRDGQYDGYGIYKQYQQKTSFSQLSMERSPRAYIPPSNAIVTFYYEGYFQSGLYSGSGVLIKGVKWPLKQINKLHQSSSIFDYLNNQIQHGMQLISRFSAKQIYIGQFSNGYKHGFGRLFTEKFQFSGQFSHNLYHGLGTIYNMTNEGKKVTQAVFKMGKQVKN